MTMLLHTSRISRCSLSMVVVARNTRRCCYSSSSSSTSTSTGNRITALPTLTHRRHSSAAAVSAALLRFSNSSSSQPLLLQVQPPALWSFPTQQQRHFSAVTATTAPSSNHKHTPLPTAQGSVIYTETDEAPALATYRSIPSLPSWPRSVLLSTTTQYPYPYPYPYYRCVHIYIPYLLSLCVYRHTMYTYLSMLLSGIYCFFSLESFFACISLLESLTADSFYLPLLFAPARFRHTLA
jgi:hypothetical protein